MNTRSRTLAKLKLPAACRDNPDLPRRFVLSMLVSMYEAAEAIKGEFMGLDATGEYLMKKKIPTLKSVSF